MEARHAPKQRFVMNKGDKNGNFLVILERKGRYDRMRKWKRLIMKRRSQRSRR
jgi:hypothetical protein